MIGDLQLDVVLLVDALLPEVMYENLKRRSCGARVQRQQPLIHLLELRETALLMRLDASNDIV